ncbi:hypothetical protein [Gramella sp. KN1008]|uniref:hypothetical protein n=1 Tax=Gramella sp. KN1008 TaxID=2529298 RepID=UPI00103FDDAD|nr:hypothetical protein [Gramella sp. KN1008]TBW28270.1 hypothetical protein EZJ28_05855 [Gramella sp. KN1008]
MNVNHDKRFWYYLEHRIQLMWESYQEGNLNSARLNLKEILWQASDLTIENFKGLEIVFNELLPIESKQILIDNLTEFCSNKGEEAKKEIKGAWREEISLINSLKHVFENSEYFSADDFLWEIERYEKESSFGQEIRFQNFKNEIIKTKNPVSTENMFYDLFRFVQLESINYNEQFWDYHLDLIQELFDNIYPRVSDPNHLKSILEEADKLSPFRREKAFKYLLELALKYDESQSAKDNLLEAYFDYKDIIHKIYEEADLEIKRRKSRFYEDFIDEENDIMNSFRNGNQDNYGY